MLKFTLFILTLICSQSFAFAVPTSNLDLKKAIDPRDLPGLYKTPTDAFLSEEDVIKDFSPALLQNKEYAVVDGKLDVLAYNEDQKLYTIYNTRVIYIKRSYDEVVKAVRPFSQQPAPAPLYDINMLSTLQLDENTILRMLDFTYKQTYKGHDIIARCQASNHDIKQSDDHLRVQTLLKNCLVPNEPEKLVFLEAIQNSDVLKLKDPNVTAALFRSLAVSKRTKVGPINIPLGEMKNAAYAVSNESFRDVLKRLNITFPVN